MLVKEGQKSVEDTESMSGSHRTIRALGWHTLTLAHPRQGSFFPPFPLNEKPESLMCFGASW